ncbi:MAG: cation diffusion facilitator family transporter [Prevotella sp.]|nr:cation diffusion facilitator family transporter [Prevotellaceae bacterium]MDY5343703.1 cation diffusion facilitator family transporter [Prevotella sp.]
MKEKDREKSIYRVTLAGSAVNVVLLVFKFVAGFLGGSAAMIADAVHSLSDFITDVIVLLFVKLSAKPEDSDHDYGHGKYETLATSLIGLALMFVGVMIMYNGVCSIASAIMGNPLPQPGMIALAAALVSIALKEWAYRFTVKVGRKCESQAVIANAWHHRSDALSSIGTAVGIGGAILLGEKWAVLDPIAAVVVSVFIIRTAWQLTKQSAGELLEQSLPADMEREIVDIVAREPMTSEVHHLRTRRIGSHIAIEMHLRMPGDISLYESHQHATNIEQKLRKRFGASTHIGLHVEPLKINGKYVAPKNK